MNTRNRATGYMKERKKEQPTTTYIFLTKFPANACVLLFSVLFFFLFCRSLSSFPSNSFLFRLLFLWENVHFCVVCSAFIRNKMRKRLLISSHIVDIYLYVYNDKIESESWACTWVYDTSFGDIICENESHTNTRRRRINSDRASERNQTK